MSVSAASPPRQAPTPSSSSSSSRTALVALLSVVAVLLGVNAVLMTQRGSPVTDSVISSVSIQRGPAAAHKPTPVPAPGATPIKTTGRGAETSVTKVARDDDSRCGLGHATPHNDTAGSAFQQQFTFPTITMPKFDASDKGRSSVDVLLPGSKHENPNLLFHNVAFRSRTLYYLNAEAPKDPAVAVKDVVILGNKGAPQATHCDRVFEGPVFYFHHQTVQNHWHIHNDNLLPLYRMMHDLGFGDGDAGATASKPPTTILLAGPDESTPGGELKFFRWALRHMATEVLDLADFYKQNTTLCMPLLRTGRPNRVFRPHPHEVAYYEVNNLGMKFVDMMRQRIPLQAQRAQWPPRVKLLQRDTANREFKYPKYLIRAWREFGVEMEVVHFDSDTPPLTQCEVMSSTDILYAVHGGGDGNLWYLSNGGVFVHILPHNLPQWELSIIRRHAQLRHLGYVSWRSEGAYEGDGWKPAKIFMKDDANDYNTLIIDTLFEYVRMNPDLKPFVAATAVNMQPQRPVATGVGRVMPAL